MIRLARTLLVSSFDAEATVAVGRARPEFLAVARLAADLARPIGARDVLRELLGPRPDVLGWRVIERCVMLGLLNPVGGGEAALSEAGRIALDHDQVLLPEEGIWRFFMAEDPLVPAMLVHAQRLDPDPVQRERTAAKDARSRGERRPHPEPVPEVLGRRRGTGPHESVQSGDLFQLVEIADQGASGPRGELRLQLTWEASPAIRLSGELPSNDGDTDRAVARRRPVRADLAIPDVLDRWSHDELWSRLITHATGVQGTELDRWRTKAGGPVVPVTFQSLPEAARHQFRSHVDVPASDLPGLGRFAPTVLEDVTVVPATADDAQDWLAWLQWQSIDDYATPAMLDQRSRAQLAKFPHHQPRPLSPTELLARARTERGDRAWFLLGPSDLGLWSEP